VRQERRDVRANLQKQLQEIEKRSSGQGETQLRSVASIINYMTSQVTEVMSAP
jgi:hypothetical protein